MKLATQDEIAAHIKAVRSDDLFGFRREVLIPYMDFEHVKPYLKEEVTAEEWQPKPLEADRVLKDARDYMAFAWTKVQNHRGLSANRSVEKLSEWCWLLGHRELYDRIEQEQIEYRNYGAQILKAVCEALGFPIPDDPAVARMAQGLKCTDECCEGCVSPW